MKLSVYLDDDTYRILERERAAEEPLSKTIARLIREASRYEVVTTLREKQGT